ADSNGGVNWIFGSPQLLTWTDYGAVALYDALTGRVLYTDQYAGSISYSGWSADYMRFYTVARSRSIRRTVRVWDLEQGVSLFDRELIVLGVELLGDGSRLLLWTEDNRGEYMETWDLASDTQLGTFSLDEAFVGSDASLSGERVLFWDELGNAWIVSGLTGQIEVGMVHEPVDLRSAHLSDAWWSPDEHYIISWVYYPEGAGNVGRGQMWLWDAQTGDLIRSFRHEVQSPNLFTNVPWIIDDYQIMFGEAAWNADGTRLLSTFGNDTVRVWDGRTGEELFRLPHEGVAWQAFWNPDGTRILTTGDDYFVRIWEAGYASGAPLASRATWWAD
ncbi:MAG: hypothetical protein JW910_01540, partial [Anaerolineae bacterium]|nr:hypothetical protein [Anaerolineae bacterium]